MEKTEKQELKKNNGLVRELCDHFKILNSIS